MTRAVKLNELDALLDGLSYPAGREAVADELADVTLVLADGRVEADAVLAETDAERFESREALASELMSRLPREAVGEPFQSEGEG